MKKINTNFKGLFFIKTKIFFDNRGFFKEVFLKKIIKKNLIFGCISKSKIHVLRGLHIQTKNPQLKVLSVVKGKIFDVAMDLRKKSPTFGKSVSVYSFGIKMEDTLVMPRRFCAWFFISYK